MSDAIQAQKAWTSAASTGRGVVRTLCSASSNERVVAGPGPWITATDASTASFEVERRPVVAFAFAPTLASLAPLTLAEPVNAMTSTTMAHFTHDSDPRGLLLVSAV